MPKIIVTRTIACSNNMSGSAIPCFALLWLLCLSINGFQASSMEQGCSSSCGNLKNITYPFRLKGDHPRCGLQDYEFSCRDNKTILNFDSHDLEVKEITDDSHYTFIIHVVDVEVVASSGRCMLPRGWQIPERRNSALSYGVWTQFPHISSSFYYSSFHYPSRIPGSMASFVNCSSKVEEDPSYHQVPCLSGVGKNNNIYVVYENELYFLRPSCHSLVMVPVDSDFILSSGSNRTGSNQDIFQILERGFYLYAWKQNLGLGCWNKAFGDFGRDFGTDMWGLLSGFNWFFLVTCILPKIGTTGGGILTIFLLIIQLRIVLVLMVRIIFAPLCIFIFFIHKLRRMNTSVDMVEKFLQAQESLTPTKYAYSDIIVMTGHFREKIGQGGFGTVFKGRLPGGYLVAVKMLGNSKCEGEDFINEVSTIGRIHHVNVVRLIGFCSEGPNRALIYEYMPNGSLDKYIFSQENKNDHPFPGKTLVEIALGIARGIEYLHLGCDMRILHFDIKPYNILLDSNFTPKVSDFGLARLYPKDYSLVSVSVARGTIGYIAPELICRSFGVITTKSDVYSFGMLVLEMAGGRKNVNPRADNSSEIYFPLWIYDQLNRGEDQQQIENVTCIDEHRRKLCLVGLWCIQMKSSIRPSMSEVVKLLEGNMDALPMPPKPFFSSPEPMVVEEYSFNSSSIIESSIISHC